MDKDTIAKHLSESPFPNLQIDPKIKATPDFGLKVAKHIYYRNSYDSTITGRSIKIRTNRMYSEGRQPIEQYYPYLDADIQGQNDGTMLNIAWDIVSPAPKFVSLLLGDMINQDYKIQFNAIDPFSRTVFSKARDEYYGKIVRQQMADEISRQTGVALESAMGEGDPVTPDEIELHMSMSFKQDVELAFEEGVDFELYNNNVKEVAKKVCRDLIENASGWCCAYFDENKRVRFRYVDLEYVVTSASNQNDYHDADYFGEVRLISIRELRRIASEQGLLSETDLFRIAKINSGQFSNPRWVYGDVYNSAGVYNGMYYNYDDFRVEVLDFLLYTIDTVNYEWRENKYGNHFLNRKDYGYVPPKESKYNKEKIEKDIEQEYAGVFIPSYNKMVKWGKSENMLRQKSNGSISARCVRKYIGYAINNRYGDPVSMLDRIRVHLDNIQILSLKMRQFVAEATPPGVAVDVDALTDVTLSAAQSMTPMQIVKMFKQKGVLIYSRRSSIDGEYMNGAPLENLPNGIGDGLQPFMNAIQYEMAQIREYTGINEAVDATKPDKDALVGIQKLQIANSNNATRELYSAWIHGIYEPLGHTLAAMIQKRLMYDPKAFEEYSAVFGKMGASVIKSLKDRVDTVELGIKTEALPDAEAVERMEGYIVAALTSGTIDIEDAILLRKVMNVGRAEQMLIVKKRKRQKAMMEEQRQKEMMTAEREKMAAQARAEADMMVEQTKFQFEMEKLKKKYELEIELEKVKGENLRAVAHIRGANEIDKIEVASQINKDIQDEASAITPKGKRDLVPGMRDPNVNTDPMGAAMEV